MNSILQIGNKILFMTSIAWMFTLVRNWLFLLALIISFSIQAKYNIFAPTDKNDGFMPSYDSEFGSVYTSWCSGVGLSYKF